MAIDRVLPQKIDQGIGVGSEPVRSSQKTGSVSSELADPRSSRAGDRSGYSVELSGQSVERSAERKKAREIAMNTPEVNEKKVEEIKAKIADGTYRPSSGEIADGLMKEAIKDRLSS